MATVTGTRAGTSTTCSSKGKVTVPRMERLDLSFLTDEERATIENVLDNDDRLMTEDKIRLGTMRQNLEQRRYKQKDCVKRRQCSVCKRTLGRVFSSGATCPNCYYRVCKQCRHPLMSHIKFLCIVCYDSSLLQVQNEYHVSSEYYGSDIIRKSLKRDSPTISSFGNSSVDCESSSELPTFSTDTIVAIDQGGGNKTLVDTNTNDQSMYMYVPTMDESSGINDKPNKQCRSVSFAQAVTEIELSDRDDSKTNQALKCYSKRDYEISGEVLLGVQLIVQQDTLIITVNRVRGLAAADKNGLSDPYIKLYLLPDMNTKRKTKVKKKTLDPVYQETFTYQVLPSDINSCTIWLSVWDHDQLAKNDFLGELYLSLSTLDLTDDTEHWYTLQDKNDIGDPSSIDQSISLVSTDEEISSTTDTEKSLDEEEDINPPAPSSKPQLDANPNSVEQLCGETILTEINPNYGQPYVTSNTTVLLTMSADESSSSMSITEQCKLDYDISGEVLLGVKLVGETLFITVNRARGLAAADKNGFSDPYIKTYLLPDKSKGSKRKTSIRKKTLDPIYNETLKYQVSLSDIDSYTIWLSVWDHDQLGRNDFLGELYLPLSTLDLTDDTEHWYTLQEKNTPVSMKRRQPNEFTPSVLTYEEINSSQDPITADRSDDSNSTVASAHSSNCAPDVSCPTPMDQSLNVLNAKGTLDHIKLSAADELDETEVSVKLPSDQSLDVEASVKLPSDQSLDVEASVKLPSLDAEASVKLPSDQSLDVEASVKLPSLDAEASVKPPSDQSLDADASVKLPSDQSLDADASVKLPSDQPFDAEASVKLPSDQSLDTEASDLNYQLTPCKFDSTTSINGSAERFKGDYEISGEVLLEVQLSESTLVITVSKARGLAAADKNGFSDPYIKTYLLPDKSKDSKRKTSIKKRTLDPIYNETLKYQVSPSDVTSYTIWLSVWDHDRLGRNKFLGEIYLPLSTLDLTDSKECWHRLQDKSSVTSFLDTSEISPQLPVINVQLDDEDDFDVTRPVHAVSPRPIQSQNLSASATSISSTYSAIHQLKGNYEISGEVLLGVQLVKQKTLVINVNRARGLAAVDKSGFSNPYVKTYLHPNVSQKWKRKTEVRRKTLNPVYNESLQYQVSPSDINTYTIWLSVWDHDRLGRNKFLGEIHLPLSTLDLTDSSEHWYTLEDRQEASSCATTAEMDIGLCIDETGSNLKVLIKQARFLTHPRGKSVVNPYVKCYLLPKKSSSKKESRILNDTVNPVWEEELVFEKVTIDDLLKKHALEVTVWDSSKGRTNELIGGFRLGPSPATVENRPNWMDSIGDEITHWDKICALPNQWITMWHSFRESMEPREISF